MVAAVRHGMGQVGQQVVCVLAPAAASIALHALMPRSILSSKPISLGLFGMTVCAPTMYAYRQPGWAWKTTLVAAFFLTALTGMIAARLQPRPSLSQYYPDDQTLDLRNAPPVFTQGWELGENQTLNFVEMTQHGQKRLIPVRIIDNEGQRSTTVCTSVSPINIYLSILKEQEPLNSMSIKTFLNYWNTEAEKDFLTAIVYPHGNQNPPIFSFSPSRACEVLQLPQCHDREIRTLLLCAPAPTRDARVTKGQTLFTSWVGQGHTDLIRAMLTLNQLIIAQIQEPDFEKTKAALFAKAGELADIKAPLSPDELGRVREAKILIDALESHSFILSAAEQIAKQAIATRLARETT